MQQLNDFFNDGYGWKCRQCYKELPVAGVVDGQLPRYFCEGEGEGKLPAEADSALARWTDKTRRFLTCPRCGITEGVELS